MIPLEPDKYYHIYNHANGRENLFTEDSNYIFFLEKLQIYLVPVVEVLAYCLMPNHFHLLINIKPEEELLKLFQSTKTLEKVNSKQLHKLFQSSKTLEKVNSEQLHKLFQSSKTLEKVSSEQLSKQISKQFSNFFSCYSQSYNKMYHRKGSLFYKNFRRKEITSEDYFRKLVNYIHFNPVLHGFVAHPSNWKYSSYQAIVSNKTTLINRDETIRWFDTLDNFLFNHRYPFDFEEI